MNISVNNRTTALLLLGAYAGFTLVIAGVRALPLAVWLPSVVVMVVVLALLTVGREGNHALPGSGPGVRAVAWSLVPLLCVPLFYAQLGALNAGQSMHDALLIPFEHRWFGEPSRTLARAYPSATVSALLHACYLSYYAIIYLPPLRLAWRGERGALDETVLALTITFVISFVCFALWPVEGPWYHWATASNSADNGIRRSVTTILQHFASRGTAFPSSHVSVAVTQMLLAWRWQRKLFWVLAPLTMGLALGAVYGGFHYSVDVIAGASLGAGVALMLMRSTRRKLSLVAVLATTGCVSAPAGQHRFYDSRKYGSEQQFNPLSQIVNEGFDLLRGDDADRRILRLPYAITARNVRSSVFHARDAFDNYGWSRLARNELFPLTTKGSGGGQWVPNYQFHLLGSGMVSARMTEWFEQHHVAHPVAWSALTMTVSHVLNEMTERPGPRSVDAATDLLLFDPAGFLLFRSDRVQRLFSSTLELTNWPLQPSFTLPSQTLENGGQQFVLRFKVPRTTQWKGLYMFGVSTLFGVSRDVGQGRSFSVAVGADAVQTPVVDSATDTRTVILKPSAGLFLDRNGSLLISVLARVDYETVASINIYPGALAGRRLPFGVWASAMRRGGFRVGIASTLGVGVAHGTVRPQ